MRIVTWAVRLIVFLPLVVVLFGFFLGGALFGILALLATVLRQRREIALLRKRMAPQQPAQPAVPEL